MRYQISSCNICWNPTKGLLDFKEGRVCLAHFFDVKKLGGFLAHQATYQAPTSSGYLEKEGMSRTWGQVSSRPFRGFLKWWVSPTNPMIFLLKNEHFGGGD